MQSSGFAAAAFLRTNWMFRFPGKITCPWKSSGDPGWQLIQLPLDKLPAGEFSFQLISAGNSAIDFDGYIICEAAEFPGISF